MTPSPDYSNLYLDLNQPSFQTGNQTQVNWAEAQRPYIENNFNSTILFCLISNLGTCTLFSFHSTVFHFTVLPVFLYMMWETCDAADP